MSDIFGIAGKTAVVTGSGRNIGRTIVLELAGCGANVIVNTRSDQAEADSVAEEARDLGVGSLVVLGDAADKATVERIRTQAEATFGGVDIYVSNAARRLYKDFFEITDEEWLPVLDTFSRHHRCGYPRQRRSMDVRISGPSVRAARNAPAGILVPLGHRSPRHSHTVPWSAGSCESDVVGGPPWISIPADPQQLSACDGLHTLSE
ncbi:SDR family NAD(P)-dependent oxidoreductase [Nocardia jiangxiensis]|uniref:SDR family NAD(P)-dependent oxidoreductase n=1 Tax=Nocardia jiangxiensis TaxID=282685 RepID=UPI0012F673AE|nr:SDR family NAD(P)-dependent oxidoreductase [Nocardia jiangxiensis]